ncbi:hypothetical protein ACFWOJ_25490 [Streptomyces sp. NPDC058439]
MTTSRVDHPVVGSGTGIDGGHRVRARRATLDDVPAWCGCGG